MSSSSAFHDFSHLWGRLSGKPAPTVPPQATQRPRLPPALVSIGNVGGHVFIFRDTDSNTAADVLRKASTDES